MEIIKFYRGERGNQNGDMLEDILKKSNYWLEIDHDYVQWLFPSIERSQMNYDAPTMTIEEVSAFEEDEDLQQKVKQSFIRFLNFLELKLTQDNDEVVIESIEEYPLWLREFNHNMLRVTRVLKSLRLTGNSQYAIALHKCLKNLHDNIPNKEWQLSPYTWQYWDNAALGDIG